MDHDLVDVSMTSIFLAKIASDGIFFLFLRNLIAVFSCIQHALSTAKKIYACETIQVALAHRAVSKALLVLQQFDTEKYYLHACEALRIAKNSLSDEHPMLYLFLHTSGKILKRVRMGYNG